MAYTDQTTPQFWLHEVTWGVMRTWDDSKNVNVLFEIDVRAPLMENVDWVMQLQRYEGGKWTTIGRREGWVSEQSPSKRIFTNVKKNNSLMRVRLTVYTRVGTKQFHSGVWVR